MMWKKLISFITPVYNAEEYLEECINSVIAQTNENWELILIDDGSTDRSGEICDRYAASYEKIKVVHKKNSGQFDSRMKGIAIASGDYCTGLDADDYLDDTCVEKINGVFYECNPDILCWNIRIVVDGIENGRGEMPVYGQFNNQEFLRYVAESTNHSFCNKLIKTELLRKSYFGNVPLNARHSEDYIMICPAICMAENIYAIDEVLYNYRQVSDSTTHKYTLQRVFDYFDSTICVTKILEWYGMLTPEIEKAEYSALVAPIGICLKKAYKSGVISEELKRKIKKHDVYSKIEKYERFGSATIDVIVFLKLFRYDCKLLLSLIYGN